jgi:hypothetical protein
MTLGKSGSLVLRLAGALALALCLFPCTASSADSPGRAAVKSTAVPGKGRLYVFREIEGFGADIDDYVTVNRVPVQRVRPGTGFYCDVSPGVYHIGVSHHKTQVLEVPVAAGQCQYIRVSLHYLGGESPRGGSIPPNQLFEELLLDPSFGSERLETYDLNHATCQP